MAYRTAGCGEEIGVVDCHLDGFAVTRSFHFLGDAMTIATFLDIIIILNMSTFNQGGKSRLVTPHRQGRGEKRILLEEMVKPIVSVGFSDIKLGLLDSFLFAILSRKGMPFIV